MKLRIRELREECGMTQKELAEKISNVQRNVSNWENGTSEPDCETILRLAELFDVSIDELFGRDFSSDNVGERGVLGKLMSELNGEQLSALTKLLVAFLR